MAGDFKIGVLTLAFEGEKAERRAIVTFEIERGRFKAHVPVRVNPALFEEAEFIRAAQSMLFLIVDQLAVELSGRGWEPLPDHRQKLLSPVDDATDPAV